VKSIQKNIKSGTMETPIEFVANGDHFATLYLTGIKLDVIDKK